jgi:fumarate reductase flavoprotein subunit
MVSKGRIKGKNIEAQLVIIGGGGAGLAAAVEASEKGAENVIVIEKRKNLGGNTALAGGLFGCESPVQVRQRIIADRDYLFKRAMEWAHWSGVDPRILRAFINKSGDTIRWLEDKGLEFDLISLYPNQQPPVQHNPKGNGARLVRVLAQRCRELGVPLFLNSSARKILRGKRGNITGVLVMKDGGEIEIKARSVIITTGGFAGNRELMNKYFPAYRDGMACSGLPLMGDGLSLAAEAGAAIEDFATMIKEGPRYDLHAWPLMALERDPATLWVNKNGERFTDETTGFHVFESVNAVLKQPGKVSFTLLDAGIRQYFEQKGLKLSRPAAGGAGVSGETSELEKALRSGEEKGKIKIAAGWDEIAGWIGTDHETLKATIAQYNSFCSQGYDEVFTKERKYLLPLQKAPCYAIKCRAIVLDTIGGIRINERMEVLDNKNKPIPGLYAAGVVTSGWESEVYCSELSASAFGYAINSGRIAGENATYYAVPKTTTLRARSTNTRR